MSSNVILSFLRLPDVYTQFRKSVEGSSKVRPCMEMPARFNPLPEGLEEGDIPSMEQLGVKGKHPIYNLSEFYVEFRVNLDVVKEIVSDFTCACLNFRSWYKFDYILVAYVCWLLVSCMSFYLQISLESNI